jgi:hypothetical protein
MWTPVSAGFYGRLCLVETIGLQEETSQPKLLPPTKRTHLFGCLVNLLLVLASTVYLGVKTHLGPKARYLLLSDSCGFVDVGCLLDERMGLSFTVAAGPRQRSHSRVQVLWTYDHVLLSQILDFPTWRTRSPYFYPSWTGWPSSISRHWFLFLLSPMTHRATTVGVSEPCLHMGIMNFTAAHYIASGETAQRNPFPTALLLWCVISCLAMARSFGNIKSSLLCHHLATNDVSHMNLRMYALPFPFGTGFNVKL